MALAFGFSLVGIAGPTAQWAAANNRPSKPTIATPFGTLSCLSACMQLSLLQYKNTCNFTKENSLLN